MKSPLWLLKIKYWLMDHRFGRCRREGCGRWGLLVRAPILMRCFHPLVLHDGRFWCCQRCRDDWSEAMNEEMLSRLP
jgi:hypothetical protein